MSAFHFEETASFKVLDFATYQPGRIFMKYMEASALDSPLERMDAPSKAVLPPEQDSASECSTADTQNSCIEDTPTEPKSPGHAASPDIALTSIGSVGHIYGLCRPCGFVHHKGGCTAGADCSFCHLCPPGTIEKQRKMKRQLVRALHDRQGQKVDSKHAVHADALVAPVKQAASLSLMAAAAAKAAAGLHAGLEV